MYGMLVRIKYARIRNFRNIPGRRQRLRSESVEVHPLYLDFWDPMILNGKKYPPRRFVPRITPNPFAKVILNKFIKWSREIPGNNTRFTIKENTLVVR